MSDTDWTPVHHEQADDEPEPAAKPPRETKPKEAETSVPLTLVMAVPPDLIAAIKSLAETQKQIATEISAQGKAILALADSLSRQHGP